VWGRATGGAIPGGVIDVVCVAGGAVAGGAVAGGEGVSAEGRAGVVGGMVAFSAGRDKEIVLIMYHSIPLAMVGARLALADSRDSRRKQVQAGCGQGMPRVLMSMRWWLWKGIAEGITGEYCGRGGRGRALFGAPDSLTFQAPLGSRWQVAVSFPKRFRGGGGLYRVTCATYLSVSFFGYFPIWLS
jgi:hypothetical protein